MTLFISTITYLIIERPMSRIAFPGSLSYWMRLWIAINLSNRIYIS
jgi:hypothetical protein